jgi:hypothetical protein
MASDLFNELNKPPSWSFVQFVEHPRSKHFWVATTLGGFYDSRCG